MPINKHKKYKMINTLKNSKPTFFSFGCSVLDMHVNISMFANDCWLATSRTIDAEVMGCLDVAQLTRPLLNVFLFFSVFSFESYLMKNAQYIKNIITLS